MQGIKSGLKLVLGSQTFPLRAVPELNVWEGQAAASFFFTWMVGDIKIKISCLVGKLKPTQFICVVLPQF